MLTVTPGARDRLSRKLAHKNAADNMAMRFTREKRGWRLHLDRPGPADVTIAHGGRNLLLMDVAVSQAMADRKLDVRNTDSGPRLTLR